MSNQDFGRDNAGREAKTQRIKETATDAFTKISGVARDAGSKAKQAASETASTMTDQVKDMVDEQIGKSVNIAGHFANSIKVAANDLEPQSPALAGLVRNLADKVEDYAEEFEGQTIDQFVHTASDFTRRQPALVFGLAAVAGFLLFRTVRNASDATPPLQPSQDFTHEYNFADQTDHG